MIAGGIQIGNDFWILSVFFFEIADWRSHQSVRKLSLRLLQLISNFAFELFAFPERIFDFFLNLTAPVIQRLSLRTISGVDSSRYSESWSGLPFLAGSNTIPEGVMRNMKPLRLASSIRVSIIACCFF